MKIKMVIKLRNIFLVLGFLVLFIGGQIVPNEAGVPYKLWEALLIAGFLFPPQYWLFSEDTHSILIENDIHIDYKTYQYIGLMFSIISSIIVTLAIFECCTK